MKTHDFRFRWKKLANSASSDLIRADYEACYLLACRRHKAERLGIPIEQLPAEDKGDQVLVLSGNMITIEFDKVERKLNEKLDEALSGELRELDFGEGENE